MRRREFLAGAARAAVIGATCPALLTLRQRGAAAQQARQGFIQPREAMHYARLPDGRVRCGLCPRVCLLVQGERGYCGVRVNQGGTYYSLVYGNPCVLRSEPMEKKPFMHVLPGQRTLTVAAAGCNLNCKYCQNWQLSQSRPEETRNLSVSPRELVQAARDAGRKPISFDLTEPVVFYEYVYDTARLARKAGLKTIVATALYIRPDPLKQLAAVVDAFKVDLKAASDPFYRDVCEGRLAPVLTALRVLKQQGAWIELVNLVVPTLNDDPAQMRQLVNWVKANLGPDTPLTFSRFEPMYRLRNLEPTPVSVVEKARAIAQQCGLHYVYLGNVPASSTGRNTYCPGCNRLLIQRLVYDVRTNALRGGKCPTCGRPVPGIWS